MRLPAKFFGIIMSLLIIVPSSAQSILINSQSYTAMLPFKSESPSDMTAPRTDLLRTDGSNFVYGSNTPLLFKFEEEGSGVEKTYYKIADLPYVKVGSKALVAAQLDDGDHEMMYYSIDRAGNQEQIRFETITIDKAGPTISPHFKSVPSYFKAGLPVFTPGVKLNLGIVDEHVEVQKVMYQINDQKPKHASGYSLLDLSESLASISDELVLIQIRAWDQLGNQSQTIIEFIVE